MNHDGEVLLTIGQLSRRTGLPVRTIRFWSDAGAVPPVRRTAGGYRLYDAESVARLELVATLRELGLGLEDIRRVLLEETSLADVARTHVDALDAQIRTLRLRRAVLSTVAKRGAIRGSNMEEMTLMNRFARLSAQERKRIIDEFLDEVLGGLDTSGGMVSQLRTGAPNLPDEPTPEQVEAWVELAELLQDQGFRRGVRALAEYVVRPAGRPSEGDLLATRRLVRQAGAALVRGVAPGSPEGARVLVEILGEHDSSERRPELLRRLEVISDPRGERYWELVGVINGWPPYPAGVPSLEHVALGLRAHRWAAEALRAHSGPHPNQ